MAAMSSLELRPRFKRSVKLKSAEVMERIRSYDQLPQGVVDVTIVDMHVTFSILTQEQHYWSPQLSLEIVEEEQGTLIKGLFGPQPKVWTMFMFLYGGLALVGLFGLMYGMVQWSLGMPATALWILLAAVILEIVCFLIARTGKQLAHEQMLQLQEQLDRILE
jgi:hypothetical protein